jgi:hypothetical protein
MKDLLPQLQHESNVYSVAARMQQTVDMLLRQLQEETVKCSQLLFGCNKL